MENDKRQNLILGMAAGYGAWTLKPFVKTLDETGYKGAKLFFINKDTTSACRKLLTKYNFEVINIDKENELEIDSKTRDTINEISPNLSRWFYYDALLSKRADQYNYILLTDTRDVLFQKDPFDFQWPEQGLHFFMENEKRFIGGDQYNASWIRDHFGEEIYESVKDLNISCSGTTIGKSASVLLYLKKMKELIMTNNCKVGGADQGVHNVILHREHLKDINTFYNPTSPIYTMGLEPPSSISFNDQGELLLPNGHIPNVLHQFDRYQKLRRQYLEPKLGRLFFLTEFLASKYRNGKILLKSILKG